MNLAVFRFWLCVLLVSPLYSSNAFSDLSIDRHIDGLVDLAFEGKNNNFIEYVKQNELIDRSDKDGHTPVYAAMFGSPGLVNDVLDLGGSIEHRDNLGFTPLISAALLGYPQAVERLLEKGADINARNNDGQTAIMVSVLGLAANQVDISAAGDNQWHNRWEKVIEVLIKKGANADVADDRGVSPLFMAIFSQNYALCRQLIKAGANVNHKLPSGVSLLQFARVSSTQAVIDLLIANGARL